MNEEKRLEYQDIIFEDLGFCGCGCPEETFLLITDFLKEHQTFKNKISNVSYSEFSPIYDQFKENIKNIITRENCELITDFIYYILNDREFMEHGTSVGSSWLTKKGEKLLQIADEIKKGKISFDEI